MERWQSGLLPYGVLLASQVLILALMVWICTDFTRGRGFRPTIPVFFHWVLAAFMIVVGLWHRRQLRA